MTTEVEARDAIVAYLHPAWVTAYPAVKVFYENATTIDLDTVGANFLKVNVEFTDSDRLGIDPAPGTMSYGNLMLQVFFKDGTGTRTSLEILGFLRTTIGYKHLGAVAIGCPRFGRKQSRSGWNSQDLSVPFRFIH
jgi:hypothetical protein